MPLLTKISLYKTPGYQKKLFRCICRKSLAVARRDSSFKLNVVKWLHLFRARFRFSRDRCPWCRLSGWLNPSIPSRKAKDLHLPTLYFTGDKTLDFYLNLTVDGQLVDQLQVKFHKENLCEMQSLRLILT